MILFIDHEPFVVHFSVEMNGQLRNKKRELIEEDEFFLAFSFLFKNYPSCNGQIPVEPGTQQRSAIHFCF